MSNIFSTYHYTKEARNLIAKSQALADQKRHQHVMTVHLLSVMIGQPDVERIFKEAGVSKASLEDTLSGEMALFQSYYGGESHLAEELIELLKSAESVAGRSKTVSVENLLTAITQEKKGSGQKVMELYKVLPNSLKPFFTSTKEEVKKANAQKYLTDLTASARAGLLDPVIGRHVEVRRLINILGRRHKNHPILVGDAGVGKRSIINALAIKIASGNVSARFSNLHLITLDAARLVSGIRTRADVETRLRAAVGSIDSANTILFINGVESLFTPGSGNNGTGDVLTSLLNQENLRIVTSTTPEAFKRLSEKEAALTEHFTSIRVEPPTVEEAVEVLRGVAIRYETFHNVKVGDPAINAAVRLAKRYLQKHSLPDSAISLLDEASARKKFEVDGLSTSSDVSLSRFSSLKAQLIGLTGDDDKESVKAKEKIEDELSSLSPVVDSIAEVIRNRRKHRNREEVILMEEDIAGVIQDWTGIPAAQMLQGESDKMGNMEKTLATRVIGQDEAVRAVSKAVRRSRLGLRDLNKPIGSFLFLGSSGVGKTEIAKALAKFLFDDDKSMIRLDMSEYMERHMAQRLIGAPPGYAQSEEGGVLTEAVSKNPYSVILLDEIEKAHSDVFNLLLQVLDDGRLTDGRGKTVDFTNTVIIMTSNIGSPKLLELPPSQFESEEGIEQVKQDLQMDLRSHLRPELLNRIDETVIFRPLSKSILLRIADIQFDIVNRMLEPKNIKLKVDDDVKKFLVDIDYLPQYGARPLKRAILKNIQDRIGERIMSGETKDGDTVSISMRDSKLFFSTV